MLADATPAPARHTVGARAIRTFVVACTLASALAACSHPPADPPAAAPTTQDTLHLSAQQQRHIGLQTISARPIHASVEATGELDFDHDKATSVIAPFTGPVVKVLVQPGQMVRKGQPLAVVDSSDYASAWATWTKAEIAARNLRKIASTDQDLLAHQGVSAREAAQAQADAASADADLDAAKRALLALGIDPQASGATAIGSHAPSSQALIRAPIAGTVAERLIAPGALLQAGSSPCFTIADLSDLWVMAQVSPTDVHLIAVGDKAQVDTGDGAPPLTGSVDNLSTVVDPDTRAVIARVRIANPGGTLRKGMYVHVRIESTLAHDGIEVPASAILRDDENLPFVYAQVADGSFARRHVHLGITDGADAQITSGLQAGDRIVTDGGLFMQFMQAQ